MKRGILPTDKPDELRKELLDLVENSLSDLRSICDEYKDVESVDKLLDTMEEGSKDLCRNVIYVLLGSE